jgi:hypothetical protein
MEDKKMMPRNFTWTTDRFDKMEEEAQFKKWERSKVWWRDVGAALLGGFLFAALAIMALLLGR